MPSPITEPVHTTVLGVFDNLADARAAVEDLRRADFNDARIGFITPDPTRRPKGDMNVDRSKLDEGVGVGAVIGAALGGVAGLVVAAGMLSPIGPAVVGGAIAAWLASLGVGAAAGTVVGALVAMGLTDDESRWYENELKKGRSLVIVAQADERAEEAREILRHHNAIVREPSSIGVYGSGVPATPY